MERELRREVEADSTYWTGGGYKRTTGTGATRTKATGTGKGKRKRGPKISPNVQNPYVAPKKAKGGFLSPRAQCSYCKNLKPGEVLVPGHKGKNPSAARTHKLAECNIKPFKWWALHHSV